MEGRRSAIGREDSEESARSTGSRKTLRLLESYADDGRTGIVRQFELHDDERVRALASEILQNRELEH